MSEGLVVLFCKSVDDVSKAEMLVVNREHYREMVRYRQKVCPTFVNTKIDEAVIDTLPDAAVPDFVVETAQAMPEAANVQTTMHGPANRIPISCGQEKENCGSDASKDSESEGSGVDAHHSAAIDEDAGALVAEPLNENETIVGIGEE